MHHKQDQEMESDKSKKNDGGKFNSSFIVEEKNESKSETNIREK